MDKLCVSKWCDEKLCVTGGGDGRRRRTGCRTKNKNPTQRCGEKDDCPTLQRISSLHVEDADTSLFKILVGCGQSHEHPCKDCEAGCR